jgi:hypothetical protein
MRITGAFLENPGYFVSVKHSFSRDNEILKNGEMSAEPNGILLFMTVTAQMTLRCFA